MSAFDELVDGSGLTEDELRRLRNVHEMLVAAGPPPELSALLQAPPPPPEDAVVTPLASRRRGRTAWALIAAVVAVAVFAGGYVLGDRLASGDDVVRVVGMEGVGHETARASVSLGEVEPGGNWPMVLTVTGLPKHASERGYYELFVWRRGKPGYPCVGFKMANGTTTVRFTVPYELDEGTKLVITTIEPGKVSWPGKVVMRTT